MNKTQIPEHLKDIILDSDLKVTNQRIAVIKVLVDNKNQHLTADEIHHLSKDIIPQIGIATIYRTVSELEKIGVIYKVEIFGDSCKYRLMALDENRMHRHFICTKCGGISDIDSEKFTSIEKHIENKYNISIESQSSIYYGLCSKCLLRRKINE